MFAAYNNEAIWGIGKTEKDALSMAKDNFPGDYEIDGELKTALMSTELEEKVLAGYDGDFELINNTLVAKD